MTGGTGKHDAQDKESPVPNGGANMDWRSGGFYLQVLTSQRDGGVYPICHFEGPKVAHEYPHAPLRKLLQCRLR